MPYAIHFGLNFDNPVFPRSDTDRPNASDTEGGASKPVSDGETHFYLGSKSFLRFLETHLGLAGHTERIEHIRIEQYRQALSRYRKDYPSVFYQISFEADQLACAQALLARRDELVLAGFDFALSLDLPERLKVLVDIENQYLMNDDGSSRIVMGEADRFRAVMSKLENQTVPIAKIYLNENLSLLPPQYKRLLNHLESQGIELRLKMPFSTTESVASDLQTFKNFIQNKLPRGEKQTLLGDGSLVILETNSDTEGAAFIAKLLRLNPDFEPTFLIPDKYRTLDEAFIQEGLPVFGLPSASLGRPTLQLLKLIPTFLWRPLDPYKILEFVTMPAKPLDHDLATVIANIIAQRPGIGSEHWFIEINRFFETLYDKAAEDATINVGKIKTQFDFLFDRPTYDAARAAPKSEITSLFAYLKDWASEEFEANGSKNTSLIVLSEHARRIEEFLNELPASEAFLSYLELERIIRTIYEPAPIQPRPQEMGHYAHVTQGDCLLEPVDSLIWWHFTDTEGVHFFSRWYKEEAQYLQERGVFLQTPQDENARMLHQRVQAVLRTANQIFFIYPKKANGETTAEHPLFSHLRACFYRLEDIVVHVPTETAKFEALTQWIPPQYFALQQTRFEKIKPILELPADKLNPRSYETLTSLESLFYYPHQWVFKHKAKLNKSSILSIVKENTLKGNLAHRFFELVLKEDFSKWTRDDVHIWVETHKTKLFRSEAATLMLYGYEPERALLARQLKHAIWTLISHIQNNGWQVHETEQDLSGKFLETPVKGKADVVLLRGGEYCVLDLKWSGVAYRERLIKNAEDLQLVMYARLLTDDDSWAHTAYFVIEKARLLARNTSAFAEIKPLMATDDAFAINDQIWTKMKKTYEWRLAQIEKGHVEIRTQQTVKDLEDIYGMALLEVLEMRDEDNKFDDYRTLIGLVK
jgi:hypothetical protein